MSMIIYGMPTVGKSAWVDRVRKFGHTVLDTDDVLLKLFGEISGKPSSKRDWEKFLDFMKDVQYDVLVTNLWDYPSRVGKEPSHLFVRKAADLKYYMDQRGVHEPLSFYMRWTDNDTFSTIRATYRYSYVRVLPRGVFLGDLL